MSRRSFLSREGLSREGLSPTGFSRAAAGQRGEELTPEAYRDLVNQYRSGRFVETARHVRTQRPAALRDAQRMYLDWLPPADDLEGFRGRLAASLLHTEATAHFGWSFTSDARLVRLPVAPLPRRGVRGIPDDLQAEAVAAWGEEGASDFRELIWRELVLTAARLRLARMDLAAATRLLEGAVPDGDPAIAWQLAAVWSVRARYVREKDLWPDARELFRQAAARRLLNREVAARSPRTVARMLGDPDDLNLRLAVVALGQNQPARAARHLAEVSEEPAPPLRAPRWMLVGETLIAEGRLDAAVESLRSAREVAPTSPAVIAALVVALGTRGGWDEAAELAIGHLALRRENRVWSDFLATWAEPEESSLAWLRNLVRT